MGTTGVTVSEGVFVLVGGGRGVNVLVGGGRCVFVGGGRGVLVGGGCGVEVEGIRGGRVLVGGGFVADEITGGIAVGEEGVEVGVFDGKSSGVDSILISSACTVSAEMVLILETAKSTMLPGSRTMGVD